MMGAGTIRLLASLLICGSLVAGVFPCGAGEAMFSGTEAVLERAITADNPEAVAAALAGGASVNGRGAHEVTPLEFAIGFMHKRAAAELIRHQADPDLKDAAGDSAVTLAVNGYTRDPELLRMVLDAGGDPNTLRADGNPVMYRFLTGATSMPSPGCMHGVRASTPWSMVSPWSWLWLSAWIGMWSGTSSRWGRGSTLRASRTALSGPSTIRRYRFPAARSIKTR